MLFIDGGVFASSVYPSRTTSNRETQQQLSDAIFNFIQTALQKLNCFQCMKLCSMEGGVELESATSVRWRWYRFTKEQKHGFYKRAVVIAVSQRFFSSISVAYKIID